MTLNVVIRACSKQGMYIFTVDLHWFFQDTWEV